MCVNVLLVWVSCFSYPRLFCRSLKNLVPFVYLLVTHILIWVHSPSNSVVFSLWFFVGWTRGLPRPKPVWLMVTFNLTSLLTWSFDGFIQKCFYQLYGPGGNLNVSTHQGRKGFSVPSKQRFSNGLYETDFLWSKLTPVPIT